MGTLGLNINASGEIAGGYIDFNGVDHGFLRTADGLITTFDVPGTGTAAGEGTQIGGVDNLNKSGAVSGTYVDGHSVSHGYLRAADGIITTFDVPGAGTAPGQGTVSSGINDSGVIAGVYGDASGVNHGFLRTSDGTITTFDVSGAAGTVVENISGAGEIVGVYVDTRRVNHGFVRAPDGTITTFDVSGAGSGAGEGTTPWSNDDAGDITGHYVDANSVYHGFAGTR
jgi:hypothetical protein